MRPEQRWTWMQVEADVDTYGGKRVAEAHNRLTEICACLRAELSSARLEADRKARIDCAVLCANLLSEHEASKIVHAIRATIPEE